MIPWSPERSFSLDIDELLAAEASQYSSEDAPPVVAESPDWIAELLSAAQSPPPCVEPLQPLEVGGSNATSTDTMPSPRLHKKQKSGTKVTKCRVRLRPKHQIDRLGQQRAMVLHQYKHLCSINEELKREVEVLQEIVDASGEYVMLLKTHANQQASSQTLLLPSAAQVLPSSAQENFVKEGRACVASFYSHVLSRVNAFGAQFLHSITVEQLGAWVKELVADASMHWLDPLPEKLPGILDRMYEMQALFIALNITNAKIAFEIDALSSAYALQEAESAKAARLSALVEVLSLSADSKQRIIAGYLHFQNSMERLHRARRELVDELPAAQSFLEKQILDLEATFASIAITDRLVANMKCEHFLYYFLGRLFFIEVEPECLLRAAVTSYPSFLFMVEVCQYMIQNDT